MQRQAQKEVTHNEALIRFDALVQASVRSRTLPTPPDAPADGERYIVPSGAIGAWAGQANHIACWNVNAWTFLAPAEGWRVHVEDERLAVVWTDGAIAFSEGKRVRGKNRRDRLVGTPNGGALRLVAIEQELPLTGPFVETAGSGVIASRMIVLAVASRVTQTITGVGSFDIGVAGNPGQFGNSLGVALGSANIGVIGPTAFYAATPIRVSANGGAFSAGRVRLILYALVFSAPTS